jgi:hypothetical protein
MTCAARSAQGPRWACGVSRAGAAPHGGRRRAVDAAYRRLCASGRDPCPGERAFGAPWRRVPQEGSAFLAFLQSAPPIRLQSASNPPLNPPLQPATANLRRSQRSPSRAERSTGWHGRTAPTICGLSLAVLGRLRLPQFGAGACATQICSAAAARKGTATTPTPAARHLPLVWRQVPPDAAVWPGRRAAMTRHVNIGNTIAYYVYMSNKKCVNYAVAPPVQAVPPASLPASRRVAGPSSGHVLPGGGGHRAGLTVLRQALGRTRSAHSSDVRMPQTRSGAPTPG